MASESSNLFLEALPPPDREAILAVASEVHLEAGAGIAQPGKRFDHVYFPIDLVTSVLTVLSDGKAIEAATVGFEGFMPMTAMLDTENETTSMTVVQVPGRTFVLSVEDFERVSATPGFSRLAARYAHAYISMMAQNVACNRAHALEVRCADGS